MKCAADVPEHKRIRFIKTQVDVEQKVANLRMTSSLAEPPRVESVEWEEPGLEAGMAIPFI